MIKSFFIATAACAFLWGCSGLEHSQQEKIRQHNAQKEAIFRKDKDQNFVIDTPAHRTREPYPWEPAFSGKHLKITKEFFRCKGSSLHPPKQKDKDSLEMIKDCDGLYKHSLPVRHGKEFVYPILLDLVNYIQAKTSHKVIITCGHRCPAHNTYSDPSAFNQSSKHMIGAEVDFYVEGMENDPEKIASLIMGYFTETAPYKGNKEYEKFLRLESKLTNVSISPWYNKEVLIKVYQKHEGRDFDNRHPYPYLSLQVRYDRDVGEKITYSWDKAFKGFLRY
jgi:hypothetical protein